MTKVFCIKMNFGDFDYIGMVIFVTLFFPKKNLLCDLVHKQTVASAFIFAIKKVIMISFIKKMLGFEELDYTGLMERGAIIIDVRTPQEFKQGHVKKAINIPLSDISRSIKKIKQKNKPIITCCRSGARSGNAASTLKSAGIEVYNGGSWNSVRDAIRN